MKNPESLAPRARVYLSVVDTGFMPPYATFKRLNIGLLGMYFLMYGALAVAPFTFSWEGLIAAIVVCFFTSCLGITLCYHRQLAHKSFKLPQAVTWTFALFACLAMQRGPVWWTACHRLHHSSVDQEGDPHSPRYSFLWSHFLWAFFKHPQLDDSPETLRRLARDIYDDPGMMWLEKNYTALNVGFMALLFGVGYALGGLPIAISVLVWGGFVRLIYCLNVTWLVNSAAHLWGYQSWQTGDDSRNNWWVALLSWGEGWHNNHHAHPRSARMGLTWREFDLTWCLIRGMQLVGLATDIRGLSKTAVPILKPR